jgi:tetratricopeptide (TPR) repeat protein
VDELAATVDYSNEALRQLGARIRNLRRRRGMTQRDLSFDGCSYSYLARIESGDRRPSPRVLNEIALRLGVQPDELTGELPTAGHGRSAEIVNGRMMIRQGRLEEAEQLLRSVLREAEVAADGNRMSEALEGLGLVAARRGDDDEALRLLEQAVEVGDRPHPAHRADLYTELTRRLLASGDTARAIAVLEDCLSSLNRDPATDLAKVVRYTLYLSQALSDAGDFGRASAVLAEALREGAEDIDLRSRAAAYTSLSRLYATVGQSEQSLAYADRALTLYEVLEDGQALSDAHLALAQSLLDVARPDAAGRHLATARQLLGPRPAPLDVGFIQVEEARHALQMGDRERAERLARESVELLAEASMPGQLGDAYLVLARVQEELGREDRADGAYRAAIENIRRQNGWHRELAKAYRWYGKYLKRRGRDREALDAFELAADLAPSNRDALEPVAAA